jgi:general secretion pathway protein B
MSLILDALNRAENERKNQNAVPDLNTLHSPQELDSGEARARPPLWWIIGGGLALGALIIVLVVILRREASTPTSILTSSSQAVVEQPVPTVAPTVSSSAPSIERASTSTATPAPVIKTAPPAATPKADVDKLYASGDAEPQAVVDRGVNELYAAEAATAAASETIVDPFNPAGSAPALSTGQEQAPPRTFDSIKNIPDFNDLPWNMRQQIPTISYARHNFLANGVSSVVINNQTSGAGNIIGTGQFIVQEIYVDGVILKHGNAVFKLRALNGWINM